MYVYCKNSQFSLRKVNLIKNAGKKVEVCNIAFKGDITPPDTAHRCLTLFSPGYSSSENMHYPVLARIQLI